jgi:hypothetical protein
MMTLFLAFMLGAMFGPVGVFMALILGIMVSAVKAVGRA